MHISPFSPGATYFVRTVECEQLDLDVRQRDAAGAGLGLALRREGAGRRGLGHAPAFADIDAGDGGVALPHLDRQRRAARAAVLERAQVVPGRVGVVDQRGEHRRHAAEDADLLGGDVLQRRLGIEAAVLDQLGAQPQAEQHVDRQRVDVERRQHAEETLLAFDEDRRLAARGLGELLHRGAQVGVGQHRPLGQPGGAAGVLQHGDAVRRVGDGVARVPAVVVQQRREADMLLVPRHLGQLPAGLQLRIDGLGRRAHLAEVADDQALQPRLAEHAGHVRVQRRQVQREQQVGLAVADLVLEHLGGVQRRVVDHRAAGLEDGEEGDHAVRRVRQVDADMHAGPDAELLQALGGAVGHRAQLAVAQALAHELDRRPVGPLRHGVVEDLLQRRRFDLDVPAHARGVGLDPGFVVHVDLGWWATSAAAASAGRQGCPAGGPGGSSRPCCAPRPPCRPTRGNGRPPA